MINSRWRFMSADCRAPDAASMHSGTPPAHTGIKTTSEPTFLINMGFTLTVTLASAGMTELRRSRQGYKMPARWSTYRRDPGPKKNLSAGPRDHFAAASDVSYLATY